MEKNESMKQEALDFLKQHVIAVVATTDEDHKPNAATVLYHIDDDMNLFFMTRKQTRKYANIRRNGRIAVVVGTGDGPGTIQAEGEASVIEDGLEKFFAEVKENKMLKELYYGPFLLLPGADLAVVRIRLDWMRYLHLNTDTQTEEYYRIIG
ncbi:TPA: hypothetical protein DDZ49_02475 [Candidatus Wolfebacteria bacterium]|uniref:Pyridoxamine 5'-phosphate oxidase N-terminal domain-containing protein n=2 Tax=Candidatus Wolfeibacteriota TaxID=1752735 RepID=A0A0G4AU02_9BACT|nr:MAG: hypothetical protein UX70_C0001G0986 [Candidatus Wolfebacteria bacterium GW2011_GWB1_47_1]HAL24245.1 hypothetical protein [Candidatus Wolfebacteria bacterium]HAS95545.1 hypothetical protein [Candidatus Wolfebacteria bacterium]HBD18623.1 hypothetical protein [Candidatus Wolfebacteria bacterium]HBN87010.1 hypothetical protein [Candidatus Wolfebacteria bacterium]